MVVQIETGPAATFTKEMINARIGVMFRSLSACVFIVAMCVAASAEQRPLMTDDVDTTPPGAVEIGAGVDFFQKSKFPLSGLTGDLTRVGDLRVRMGFAANVELEVEGTLQNFLAINTRGTSAIPLNVTGNSTNDIGDFTISTKFRAAE